MQTKLERWRDDTPIVAAGRIHLNNAGAGAMPRCVSDAITAHLDLEQTLGGYEAEDAQAEALADTYQQLARLLGCQPRNIAIVENATVAYGLALSTIDFGPDDVVLTTRNDYISNQLMFLSMARRLGIRIVRAKDLACGGVDPGSMRALIDEHRPKIVSVTHVPTNSGLVQPIAEIGALCAAAGVPYLVDACQSIGQMPVDVSQVRCDYLSSTARKFLRGPRGIGFLYVSDAELQRGAHPLLIDMRSARWTGPDQFELAVDSKRFENWEFPHALVLGLGAAARYALEVGIDTARDRAHELGAYAREQLGRLPRARLLDRGEQQCAIVTVELAGVDATDLQAALVERRINTTASVEEYAVIDMQEKGVKTALRISPHYYNTHTELDTAIAAIAEFMA